MRLFVLLVLSSFVLLGFGSARADDAHVWVLAIGVSKYKRSDFYGLDSASSNASRMAQALVNARPEETTTVYERTSDSPESSMYPNLANILYAIADIGSKAKPGDRVVVYFCGQVIESSEGDDAQQYLLLVDASDLSSKDKLKSTCLNVGELREKLEAIPCAGRLLCLDVCRETPDSLASSDSANERQPLTKSFENAASKWKSPGGSSATLFGCRAEERVLYGNSGQSFFSEALIDGLNGQAADDNGAVSLNSLAEYVCERVPRDVQSELGMSINQHPRLTSGIRGFQLGYGIGGIGSLRVESDPAGARVFVQGASKESGSTPLTLNNLRAGKMIVRVSKGPEYGDQAPYVTIKPGEQAQLNLTLVRSHGAVVVKSIPSGGRVFVDQETASRGISDDDGLRIDGLLPGDHWVRVAMDNYLEWRQPTTVKFNSTKEVIAELIPMPGSLVVTSTPSGASISLDDDEKELGRTPSTLKDIRPGMHRVRVFLTGYAAQSTEVSVGPKAQEAAVFTLQALETARIEVRSNPTGARIFVDDKEQKNTTPALIDLDDIVKEAREVKVEVRLDGYPSCRASALLKPGDQKTFNLDLIEGKAPGEMRVNPKDGAQMVWVPDGEFLMGSKDGADEKPQRKVHLSGYWMYKNEVTVAQYLKFCSQTGHPVPSTPSWGWYDDHPVVNVAWQDAQDYAKWAGATLPTEAQWEKAARGTDGRIYPWGNKWEDAKCNQRTRKGRTRRVGSSPTNVSYYGCIDMAGSVWEWCADWYSDNYALADNPTGPTRGTRRVLRGGGWSKEDDYARCAARDDGAPALLDNRLGFRCARILTLPVTPSPPPPPDPPTFDSYKNSFALLIGVNKYPNLPEHYRLHWAVDDVMALREVLIGSYGFPAANVVVLTDEEATQKAIEDALSSLTGTERVKEDDRVLVYFSGHGETVKYAYGDDAGFLLPYDAEIDPKNTNNPEPYLRTAVGMETIWGKLDLSAAKQVLILADACYGGLIAQSRDGEGSGAPGMPLLQRKGARQVITAGSKSQQTQERADWGHGAFTLKLLEELKNRAASIGKPFSTEDLFTSLSVSVKAVTQDQTPQLYAKGSSGSGPMNLLLCQITNPSTSLLSLCWMTNPPPSLTSTPRTMRRWCGFRRGTS